MGLFGISLKDLGNVGNSIEHFFGVGTGGGSPPPTPAPSYRPSAPQANPYSPTQLFGGYQSDQLFRPPPPPAFNPAAPPPPQFLPPQQDNKKKTDFIHNPVTNFLGDNLVKPIAQPFIGTAKSVAALPQAIYREVQNKPIDDIQRRVFGTNDPTRIAEKIVGNTVGVGLTIAAPGAEGALEAGAAKALPAATSALVPKVAANAVLGAGFGASAGASQGDNAKNLLISAAEGGAGGGVLPLIKPAAKAIIRAGEKAPASEAAVAPPPLAAAPKAVSETVPATVKAATKAAAQVQAPKLTGGISVRQGVQASTGVPEIDKAINAVATHYNERPSYAGKISDIAEQTAGRERLARRLSSTLGATLKKHLTSEENGAVDNWLDGHPTNDLTPKAMKVANALRPLYEQGHDVLTSTRESVGHQPDYSPRYRLNTIKGAATGAAQNVAAKVNKAYGDRFDLSTERAVGRQNDKFVGPDNTLIGTPAQHGLTQVDNGLQYLDKNGKSYTRQHATKEELDQAGIGPHVRTASSNARLYHSDILGVKARADAINQLKTNPGDHGVYTKEQVDSGVAPKGVKEIVSVKGLEDHFASEADAKTLRDRFGFSHKATPVGVRAYDAVSNFATQAIVLNPWFHTANQLVQAGIAAGNLPGMKGLPGHGLWSVAKHAFNISEEDVAKVLKAGAGGSTYGSDKGGLLADLTHGVTKLNGKAMSAIELHLRAMLYKGSVEKGMSSVDAAANINKFLGSTKHVNEIVQRAALFAHYFRTMSGAIGEQVSHPIQQRGSISNALFIAGLITAVSKGYSELTGNPNASMRAPGELGLLEQGYHSAKAALKGDAAGAASIITNRINPVLKEAGQQYLNKDAFTKQDVDQTPKVKAGDHTIIPGGRGGHAIQSLFAPSSQITKEASGSRSAAELISNEAGFKTPHAKGYQAAPSGNANFLNTKGAVVAKQGDPTGHQQQTAFYQGRDQLKNQFKHDTTATDALNTFLDHNHDPKTGGVIQQSPAQRMEAAGALVTRPDLLDAVHAFEKSQPNHDPKWNLDKDKLGYLMTYDALLQGSPDRAFMKQRIADSNGKSWMTDLQAAQQKYYDNLPKIPGAKPPEPNGPGYPKFDPTTQDLMTKYDQGSVDQRSELIKAHGAELASAWNSIAQWSNKQRVAQAGKDTPQFKLYPTADADTQKILNTFNALPKNDGKYGGSPERAAWIKANPEAYAKMQDFMTKATMFTLEKDASIDRFQGAETSQQELKDIDSVGKYDIGTRKNADGTTSYSLGASPGFTTGGGSANFGNNHGGHGGSSAKLLAETKLASQNRDAEHAAKAARQTAMVQTRLRSRRAFVHIKGSPKVNRYKVKQASVGRTYVASVKLKTPSSNRVKLKV